MSPVRRPRKIADGNPLRLKQDVPPHPRHRALGRPRVKPMPEDGGESEPDPAAGDPQEGGNQQGPVLPTEDVVDEDVQQPWAGNHHGGIPRGHCRSNRVIDTRPAQIRP